MAAKRDPFDRVLTVPNTLSIARLALVPVFLYFLVVGNDIGALITLVVSSFTDFLDGFLARQFNQITRLGQLLDPAADRLYIFAALIGLASRELVPWWLVAIVVGRDIVLLILGVVLANVGYGPLPVHQLGKVATFALFFGLPAIMLGLAFPSLAWWAQPLGWAITLWGAFLYWWAGIIYAVETVKLVRAEHGIRRDQSDTLERQEVHVIESTYGAAEGAQKGDEGALSSRAFESKGAGNTDTTLNFSDEMAAQLAALDSVVSVEEQEAIAALPSGSALLIVRRGPNTGARFLLDADVALAGRHPDANIFLDDVTVSRRHAEFRRSGVSFSVKDLGSLNGTYFEGARVEDAPLTDGAEVQVGKFRLTFYASRRDLVPSAAE